jgi:pimeloyl-ACP methyl ester carboxylesterase
LIHECDRSLRRKGIDVSAYTNSASADDVDDLRTAIGASKISLIGHSYGTVLAQEILRRHPANVDRLVFANVEGDDQLIALPHLWDALLQKLSLIAAADTAVPTEEKDILALANRVARRLDAHPATLHVRNAQSGDTATLTVGGFGLRWLFRNYAADARTYAGYPALLLAIDRGDYTKFSTEIGAHYFGFGRSQMATVTDCSVGWTNERFALAERDTGAFFAMVNNQWRSGICKSLGYMGRPAVRPLLVSTAPALFISGTLDANTPAFQAEALRYGFLHSVHLVIENAGHETLPSAEVQALILDFFRGTDVSTRHIAFPPPRFASLVRRE